MAIFGDRFPSVKSGVLGAGPLCHPGRDMFQVLLRFEEIFWKNWRCVSSSISEPRDVMLRGFSLAEGVSRRVAQEMQIEA